LNEEIKELERKNTIISTINDDEVDDLIGILDRLLPDIEDYFSILYTLENISYKTGFRIVSYSIKFNKKQSNKIQLAVEGGGSLDTFLDFLDSYQFKGGRLITIDNIKFSPDNFRNSLTLNFYTKQVKDLKEQTELTIDKKTINKINKIAEDFKLNNIEPLEKPSEEHYSVKTNPFAL
jgi:hypothetical protein